jgi:hypothetical protein
MAQKKQSTSDPLDIDLVALGAMLTSIACYLLYFSCVPVGWQSPIKVSFNRFTWEALCTNLMTASLAGIGAAYSRLSEQEDTSEEDRFRDQTSSLLGLATGAFLIASSVSSALGAGKAAAGYQETLVSGRVRAIVRGCVGLGVGLILPQFTHPKEFLAILVPTLMLALAWWEYLGCAPRPAEARAAL